MLWASIRLHRMVANAHPPSSNEKAATDATAFLSPKQANRYFAAARLRLAGVLRFAVVLARALRAGVALLARMRLVFGLALVFAVPIMMAILLVARSGATSQLRGRVQFMRGCGPMPGAGGRRKGTGPPMTVARHLSSCRRSISVALI